MAVCQFLRCTRRWRPRIARLCHSTRNEGSVHRKRSSPASDRNRSSSVGGRTSKRVRKRHHEGGEARSIQRQMPVRQHL